MTGNCSPSSQSVTERQSKFINELIPEGQEKISTKLVTIIFILGYLGVPLFVPFSIFKEGHPIETISNVIDNIWMLCVVFWVFCASKLINFLNSDEKGSEIWFNQIWSLLFGPIYFNYKINKMIEETYLPLRKMILRQAQNNNLLQLTLTPNGLLAVRTKFLSRSLSVFVSQNKIDL